MVSQNYLYLLLRCLNADPAIDFVVLLVLPLFSALLAFLATLLDVLAIIICFSCEWMDSNHRMGPYSFTIQTGPRVYDMAGPPMLHLLFFNVYPCIVFP